MRPSWDEYYLGIAGSVSLRADCTRRLAGAVIVKDHRIVGQGYNGAPPGHPGCLSAGACPRGRHFMMSEPTSDFYGYCACGNQWPCADAVPPLSSYDTGPGACIAVHAEANAIIRASWTDLPGSTIYMVPGKPCDACNRLIQAAMIHRVVWPEGDAWTHAAQ